MNGQERLSYVPEKNMSATRNSPLRRLAGVPAEYAAKELHRVAPGISADHITFAGLGGVVLGSAIAATGENPNLAMGILTASSSLDGLDGPMARLIKAEDPSKANPHGGLIDAGADRIQEGAMGASRIIAADKRGDKKGKILAFVSTVSNGIPSFIRAISESRGISVSESGGNILGFFGTRTGRTITGTLATAYPEEVVKIKVGNKSIKFNLQHGLDALNIAANSFTTISRLRAIFFPKENQKPLEQKVIKEAKERAVVMGATFAANVMAAGIAYKVGRIE